MWARESARYGGGWGWGEGGQEGALEESKESRDAVTAAVSMEVERLIINNGHNFCSVINILDKDVMMSDFSTFTLEINSISLKFSVSILFLN